MIALHQITGVILAGGRASRMGGKDKGLMVLNGKRMIEYVVSALRPQVGDLLINANRHTEEYAKLSGCEVISDSFGDFAGPLAGMLAGLQAAKTDYVLFVPCDSPCISPQLSERLSEKLLLQQADVCIADSGSRLEPVFVLMKSSLGEHLLSFLEAGGRKTEQWYGHLRKTVASLADFPETFLNINTPDEHAFIAAQLLSEDNREKSYS